MAAKCSNLTTIDEFSSGGYEGVMGAVEKFEPGRGYKFETYAAMRIRGAMLDSVRACDYVPRLVRQQVSIVLKTKSELRTQLGRSPDDEELMAALVIAVDGTGHSAKTVLAEYNQLHLHGITSLNEGAYRSATDALKDWKPFTIGDVVASDEPDPSDASYYDFEAMLKGLTEDERLLIILYYREEFTMKVIGSFMGLSESRVSQLHDQIIKRLGQRITTTGCLD